jgi:hypothetical protein
MEITKRTVQKKLVALMRDLFQDISECEIWAVNNATQGELEITARAAPMFVYFQDALGHIESLEKENRLLKTQREYFERLWKSDHNKKDSTFESEELDDDGCS